MFEYRCTSCSHRFEQIVFGDVQPDCPSCGAKVEQLFSAFAVGRGGDARREVTACGACGDPRGPGACQQN